MDSRVVDWVDSYNQGHVSDDDFSDDDSADDTPPPSGSGSIYSDLAAFFASMRSMNPDLPILVLKSPKEVRIEARQRSRAVGASYAIVRHEPTIHRRWGNKTKAQKLKLLLAAWPRMPAVHRPDFAAFRKESPKQRDAGSQYRESFMWPHVNQEDLAKPRPLLL